MTPEERIKYIDIGLRILNIQVHPEILKNVILVIDVVDKRKGKTNIKDIISINNNTKRIA